jgi:hypothetical protein
VQRTILPNPQSPCRVIVWVGNLTRAIPKTKGNCYLKDNANNPNVDESKPGTGAGAEWINPSGDGGLL